MNNEINKYIDINLRRTTKKKYQQNLHFDLE